MSKLENSLLQEISGLRNGYGFRSNILDALELTNLLGIMDCIEPSPDYMASRMLELIKAIMSGPEAEFLCAALNLLQGYEHIVSPEARRLKYYKDCYPGVNPSSIKSDTLYKREMRAIQSLVNGILKLLKTAKLGDVLKKAPRKLSIPKPQYTKQDTEKKDEFEMALTLGSIYDDTRIIPKVASGVEKANVKLDEMMRPFLYLEQLTLYLEQLKLASDIQANAGLNTFVHTLLAEDAKTMCPDDYAHIVKITKTQVEDALSYAVLNKLSERALKEIENYPSDDFERFSMFILRKAHEENLDLQTIAIDTLVRFAEYYTPSREVESEFQELAKMSVEELDCEILDSVDSIDFQPYPIHSIDSYIQTVILTVIENVKKRNFDTATAELSKLFKSVLDDKLGDEVNWLYTLLIEKTGRLADVCKIIRGHITRPDYDASLRYEDSCVLKSILLDCHDFEEAKYLLEVISKF